MAGAGYGYGRVPPEGYLGFVGALSAEQWASVSLPTREAGKRPAAALVAMPEDVRWKLRAATAISALAATTAPSGGIGTELLDSAWDSSQRYLALEIELLSEGSDPAVNARAERLRAALLSGDDCAQTGWDYHREVDFGRLQVLKARTPPLSDDVRAAELDRLVREIEVRTEALAEGIGRGTEGGRPTSRWMRMRDALAECARAFTAIHDALDWDIEQAARGDDRDRLIALRRPLDELLARYANAPDLFAEAVPDLPPAQAPTAAPPAIEDDPSDAPTVIPKPVPSARPARKTAPPGTRTRKTR